MVITIFDSYLQASNSPPDLFHCRLVGERAGSRHQLAEKLADS